MFSTYFGVWVFVSKRKIPIMLLMSGVVDDLLGCFCDDVNNISYDVDDFVDDINFHFLAISEIVSKIH